MLALTTTHQQVMDMASLADAQTLQSCIGWERPVPLSTTEYTVIGRLNCCHRFNQVDVGHTAMRDMARGLAQHHGLPTAWIREVCTVPNRARYVTVYDPLHPNTVSRFHAVVRHDSVNDTYAIQDLDTVNGVYLDDIRMAPGVWVPLPAGTRVRFAPLGSHIKRVANDMRHVEVGLTPPSAVDKEQVLATNNIHPEYVFSRVPSVDCIKRVADLAAMARPAVVALEARILERRKRAREQLEDEAAAAAAVAALQASLACP